MPTRVNGALVDLIISGAVITLVPHNSEAKADLDAFFEAHGAKTTVAITNVDANRSGYGDTSAPYKSVICTFS